MNKEITLVHCPVCGNKTRLQDRGDKAKESPYCGLLRHAGSNPADSENRTAQTTVSDTGNFTTSTIIRRSKKKPAPIMRFTVCRGQKKLTGEFEELTCWENQVAMLMCFHRLGYKNIIASDIDDLRTADIPIIFKGTNFITIKLVCSDLNQIQEQMRNRPNNGLIDFELQKKMIEKNMKRNPLINEVEIDVAGKSIGEVLEQSINIIETTPSCFDYEYEKSPKEMFYSWVFANGLR